MGKATVVASVQHILAPGFGGDLASVLTNFTDQENWGGTYVTGGLKLQL